MELEADGPIFKSALDEVELLPLLVRLMYSAMASASRSRIRLATGEMAGVEGVDGVTRVVVGASLVLYDNGVVVTEDCLAGG